MLTRQQSFQNQRPTLYLVPTPIGNLNEFSPRAIEILKSVDIIAAEDTRTSSNLLNKFDIHTRLIAHHNFNEKESTKGIIELLNQGKNIAVISDAGYPLISDPGYFLVQACIENQINVVPLSGPSAGLNALVASGLTATRYLFYGFLNSNLNEAKKELLSLENYPFTLIFYVSPHKVSKTVALVAEILGNRKACLARELTKKYEEFIRGDLKEILTITETIKGEMVLIVDGKKEAKPAVDMYQINLEINQLIIEGMSTKQAIANTAKKYELSKNELYNEYHKQIS